MAQRNLVVRFLGDDRNLTRAFARARLGARTLARSFRLVRNAALGISAAAVAIGVGAVIGLRKAAEEMDRVEKAAGRLGFTMAEIQETELAFKLGGSDLETAMKLIERLQKSIGQQLLSPTKELGLAFAAIGTTAASLAKIDHPISQILRVMEGVEKLDPQRAQAVLAALMGRGAATALPALQGLAENWERAARALRETGLVLDENNRAATRFQDAWEVISAIFNAIPLKTLESVFKVLAPAAEQFEVSLIRAIKELGGGEVIAARIATALIEGVSGAIELAGILADTLGPVATVLAKVATGIKYASNLTALPRKGLETAGELAGGAFDKIEAAILAGLEKGQEVAERELPEQTQHLRDLLSAMRQGVPAVAQ